MKSRKMLLLLASAALVMLGIRNHMSPQDPTQTGSELSSTQEDLQPTNLLKGNSTSAGTKIDSNEDVPEPESNTFKRPFDPFPKLKTLEKIARRTGREATSPSQDDSALSVAFRSIPDLQTRLIDIPAGKLITIRKN